MRQPTCMSAVPIITPEEPVVRRRTLGQYSLPLAIWTVWIAYASLAPPGGLPNVDFPLSDKIGHLFLFGIWGALWMRAWVREGSMTWTAGILAMVVASGWGYYLEVLQSLTDYRTFDLLDLAADAVGALIGILAFALWRRRLGGVA